MAGSENRRIHIWINDKEVKNNIKSISAEYRKLRNSVSAADRGSKEYNKNVQQLKATKKVLDDHNKKIMGVSRSWQQMKSTMVGVFAGNLVTSAMTALGGFIPDLLKRNAELSDSYADVAKTTGLTMQQVRSLSKELKKIDTRTSRKDLLLLARDAGKLGIQGSKNIAQFVKAADQINVALGEDLGDGAIKEIGKLNEVFKVTSRKGFDLEKSMLSTGSAINALGQSSTASEAYLVNYTNRLAGANSQAAISIENTLGMAATLDQLGQKAEMSSTAVSQLTINMFKDTAEYAKIAGLGVQEFADLLANDANEAMLQVLEGINGNNEGLAEMVKKFDELGVDGARATQVIATLAGNTKLLREQQTLANKEFSQATSLTNEFDVKNQNLAANLAKVQKRLAAIWVNSGLNKLITSFVGRMAEAVKVEDDHVAVLKREQGEMNLLINTLAEQEMSQKARSALITKINTKYGDYLPNLITEKDTLDQIRAAQSAANQEIMKKIILQSYQEEITEILKAEKQAIEGVVEAEMKLAETKQEAFENADGARVNELEYTKELAEQGMMIFQSVADETSNKLETTEEKYKRMAEKIGLVWETLMGELNASNDVLEQEIKSGAAAMGDANEKAAKVTRDAWLYSMETILEQQSRMSSEYAEEQRRLHLTEYEALEEDYINRLISHEEFLAQKAKLDMAAEALKRANEHADYQPTVSEPTNFSEWIVSGRADELLAKLEDGYYQAAQMYGSYLDIMNNLDERRMNEIQSKHDRQVDMLDRQLESETISRESYDYQLEKLENAKRRREHKIELQNFRREKAFALTNVGIQTALAVMKAFVMFGPPPSPAGIASAALAVAAGGLQAGVIASKAPPQLALGGVLPGPSHAKGGMPIINPRTGQPVAEVEGNEILLTKGVSRNPVLARMASALNVAGGGRALFGDLGQNQGQRYFAEGGVMPSAGSTESTSDSEVLAALNKLNQNIETFPRELRANVLLDDIDRGYSNRSRADAFS